MTRREWLTLVGRLGVIGAAAAVGIGSHAHAVTRPLASLNPLFLNVSPRPVASSRTEPRLVTNLLSRGNGSSSYGHDRYRKDATSSWGDFPSGTAGVTWGYNVDGGQWFEVTSTAGVLERVWASVSFQAVVGETYLVSFTVDSKTGTHLWNNAELTAATFTGGTTAVNNPSPGRYVLGGRCTVGGTCTVRMGIGTSNVNPNNATIRFSNVMVERVPEGTSYPGEYVRPGDQHVFNYTRSGSVASGAVGTPTHGTPYDVPRRSSVLVLGDSFANDPGDYPDWLRWHLRGKPIAVNGLGVAGNAIAAITSQIADGVSRLATSPTAVPYTLCLAHGGVNDVNGNRTLAQMQADRLAQIAAIEAAGMLPVLLTTSPLNASTAGQQTVMDGYNAWLKTLGYPLYDLFTDASDGNADFKSTWGSVDGVHPSSAFGAGFYTMGQRLADLIMLVGDR